jgi:hypothetical protein
MSKILLFCSFGITCGLYSQTTQQSFDQVQKQEYEQQKAQVCTYFSQLVGNFLNIVQNPHNSAHVTGNIAEILDNVVKIAVSCMKRCGISLTDDDVENIMHTIDDELGHYGEVIRSVIIKRTQGALL